MTTQEKVIETITGQGLLPLYYNADPDKSIEIMRALYVAGIRAIEFTNRGTAAPANFKRMVEVRNKEMKDLLLGVGTIKFMPEAASYMEAGADFLVGPGLVKTIARFSVINSFLYIPGCMTPSEIIAAENIGIKFIKLFPGNLLGTAFMDSVREIFPSLMFMPTGGVEPTTESIGAWFKSGVSAVGLGSKLISKKMMEAADYPGISRSASETLQIIHSLRKPNP